MIPLTYSVVLITVCPLSHPLNSDFLMTDKIDYFRNEGPKYLAFSTIAALIRMATLVLIAVGISAITPDNRWFDLAIRLYMLLEIIILFDKFRVIGWYSDRLRRLFAPLKHTTSKKEQPK